MAKGTMTSTTCYLKFRQHEQLKILSARTGVPIAEYVRQGIDRVLKKHRKKVQP